MFDIMDVSFHDAQTLVSIPSHRRQMIKAHAEGRLYPDLAALLDLDTGKFPCATCGMSHWDAEEAKACCSGMMMMEKTKRKKPDGPTSCHTRTDVAILNGRAIAETICARMGTKNNREAEERLGVHLGYLSKISTRKVMGMTEDTYFVMKQFFAPDEVPFVGERGGDNATR